MIAGKETGKLNSHEKILPETNGLETNMLSAGMLLRVWLMLSFQSFGGGVATLALIRQTVVDRCQWVTEAEFTRDWTMVQAVPGINLLALTILIGKRLSGWRGILACVTGLLLPSVTITILLTAGYAHVQRLPLARAALHGVMPAIVGLGAVTTAQIMRVSLLASRREGNASFAVSVLLMAASALAAFRAHGSILPILCAAGLVGAVTHWQLERIRKPSLNQMAPNQAAPNAGENTP